jgi:hypothetical protein
MGIVVRIRTWNGNGGQNEDMEWGNGGEDEGMEWG